MPNYINKFQIGFSKVDAYLSVGVGGGQENNGTHWRDHFVCAPGLLRQLAEAAAEAATERAGSAWGSTAFRAISRPFLIGRALDHAPDGAGGPLSACGSAA